MAKIKFLKNTTANNTQSKGIKITPASQSFGFHTLMKRMKEVLWIYTTVLFHCLWNGALPQNGDKVSKKKIRYQIWRLNALFKGDPEPNGLRRQNCVTAEYQTTIEEFAVFDRECNLEEYGTICQNEEFPTLILRYARTNLKNTIMTILWQYYDNFMTI